MSAPTPFPSRPQDPALRPFPARGVPGGWHDPWDGDPVEAMVATLRQQQALRRRMSEAGVQLELAAQVRTDGRWEAHVAEGDGAVTRWPSVNGPTVSCALDALEAELRELIRESGPERPTAGDPLMA
jgi:hypothetical protein